MRGSPNLKKRSQTEGKVRPCSNTRNARFGERQKTRKSNRGGKGKGQSKRHEMRTSETEEGKMDMWKMGSGKLRGGVEDTKGTGSPNLKSRTTSIK